MLALASLMAVKVSGKLFLVRLTYVTRRTLYVTVSLCISARTDNLPIVTLFVGCMHVLIQLSAMELMIGFAEVVTSVYSLRMSVMETMNVWTVVMNLAAAELMVRRSTYVRICTL